MQTFSVTLTITEADGDTSSATYTVNVNDLSPTAIAGVDQSVLEGATVQFDGSGSTTTPGCDSFISYQWNFGDGTNGIGPTPTHIYASQGIYNITLIVIDSDGSISSDSLIVSVGDNAPLVSLVANQTSGIEPLAVSFTCSLIGGGNAPYQFSMNFGNGITDILPYDNTTSAIFITTYQQDGTYTAVCAISDVDGSTGNSTQIITVQDTIPLVNFTYNPASPIEGQAIQFNDLSSAYDIPLTYSWNFGDGNTSTSQNPTHTYIQNGIYNVVLTVTDSDGDAVPLTKTVNVNDTVPTAALTAPASAIEGTTVNLVGFGTAYDSPVSYSWNFGDGNTGIGQVVNHVYLQQGNYNIVLTVTDNDGSTATANQLIIINDTSPSIVASAVPYPFVQEGVSVQFYGNASTAYDTPLTYSWNFGDGVTSTAPTPTHSYTSQGNYFVNLTITDSDGSSNSTILSVVIIDAVPIADFTYLPNSPNEGASVQFSDLSIPGYDIPLTYSWNFGDGVTSTSQNPTHTYADNGNYVVSLTVTDGDGSTATDTSPIQINDVNPTANAGADQSVQVNSIVQFSGTGTPGAAQDPIILYTWDFGDGSPVQSGASLTNPTHTYANSGTYTVTLTVNDEDSSVSDTLIVNVFDIVVNEFEQNPISGSEWIELFNAGIIPVDISGWQIWDALASPSLRHTIPASTILNPGQYYTANVTNLNNNPEALTLRNTTGIIIYDDTPSLSEIASSDGCWARVPNGADTNNLVDWTFQTCSRGATNDLVPDVTPPSVTLLSPANASVDTDGDVTIIYSVSDDLASSLSCDIWSDTSGTWQPDTTQTTSNGGINNYNYAGLSNGNAVWNVECSDGTNSAFGISNFIFTVNIGAPVDNPPIANIQLPINGSIYNQGDNINFVGYGIDTEDGDLTASIVWSSDIDGSFGTGGNLNINTLSPGVHTITLTATDSVVQTGTDTITLTINSAGSATLDGFVSDGIGNKIYNATVQVMQGGFPVATVNTNDINNVGYYLFSTLTSGTYNIVISKLGFVTQTISNFIINAGANTQNINLIQDSSIAGSISGSVIDILTNNKIPNAKVTIRENDAFGQIIQVVYTSGSGNFIVTGLPSTIPTFYLEAEAIGSTFIGGVSTSVVPGDFITEQYILMTTP